MFKPRIYRILNKDGSFLFVGVGSGEFGEFSSENEDFVSLEISQRFSSGLTGIGFSQAALGELLSNILFFKNGFDFSGFSTSEDLDDLSGELESSDGNNLSADALSINQNSLVIENIDNSGKFACFSTKINSDNSTDFYELSVSLNERMLTILKCGELY